MALYRLGRASSIMRAQLKTVNGMSGHVSRNSIVDGPLPGSEVGLLRHSPFMKAELQNGRSMFQLQFGVRYLSSAGAPSTNETATPAPTPGNIGQSAKVMSHRPLSPHLPIYKPQSSSMLSIIHRITSVYLVGVVLAYSVIFLQMAFLSLAVEFDLHILRAAFVRNEKPPSEIKEHQIGDKKSKRPTPCVICLPVAMYLLHT